jgi:hypothetical protein
LLRWIASALYRKRVLLAPRGRLRMRCAGDRKP